jgi:DNA-directed RNA polymerase subunit N (RpoN/RPB10)
MTKKQKEAPPALPVLCWSCGKVINDDSEFEDYRKTIRNHKPYHKACAAIRDELDNKTATGKAGGAAQGNGRVIRGTSSHS